MTRLDLIRARLRYIRGHVKSILRHAKGIATTALGPEPNVVELWEAASNPTHPSQLCACLCGSDAPKDRHEYNCAWIAQQCRGCGGAGYCRRCGGDAVDPEAHGPVA
jgi:hypothetical protein